MMPEEEVSQVEQAPVNVLAEKKPVIPQPVQDTPEDKFGIYDTEQDFSAVQGSDISQQVSDTEPKIKQQQEAEAAYQEKINEKCNKR